MGEFPSIVVTGTPGTGKTTLCRLLEDELNKEFSGGFSHVDLAQEVLRHQLYRTWNERFNVPEFDEDLVCDFLQERLLTGGLIVEFHSTGFLPRDWFSWVAVLRAGNTQIYDRLAERGYNDDKLRENVECEIFNVVMDEVTEAFDAAIVIELQSNEPADVENNLQLLLNKIKEKIN